MFEESGEGSEWRIIVGSSRGCRGENPEVSSRVDGKGIRGRVVIRFRNRPSIEPLSLRRSAARSLYLMAIFFNQRLDQ